MLVEAPGSSRGPADGPADRGEWQDWEGPGEGREGGKPAAQAVELGGSKFYLISYL